jgi:hypothetical protein
MPQGGGLHPPYIATLLDEIERVAFLAETVGLDPPTKPSLGLRGGKEGDDSLVADRFWYYGATVNIAQSKFALVTTGRLL